jgi:hypothetical protein
MTARQYRAALAALGLTQNGVGELLGVHKGSGRRWAAHGVTGPAAILLRLLETGKVKVQDVDEARAAEEATK